MSAEHEADERAAGDPALSPTLAADVDPALAPTLGGSFAPGPDPAAAGELSPERAGRYERGAELGRGGMGRVVEVLDAHLGREVAMKELLIQGPGGSGGAGLTVGVVTRFVREARITGQLEHPNIVPVHELGRRADGTLYYTMKRIRGRSLASVLREATSLDARLKLLPRFRDVCEAVAYAHSRGVVHRDVKPDNVMVGEFGETLVVDWGLAKVRGEDDVRRRDIERQVNLLRGADAASTIDGQAIGTPAYMSPEQARGDLDAIDERSDVWGLGAMLFEILAGRPPYEGDSALAVLHEVLEQPAPRVRDVAPSAPPELAAIADRALLRDPSSRYPDARALAREIVAYEEGRQVHAYDYSALDQARRFVGRHRAGSVAALLVALAVLGAALVSYFQLRSEQEARAIAQSRRAQAEARLVVAEEGALSARVELAGALVERAERALDEGDPSAAAVYAAGALLRDPANPSSPEFDAAAPRVDREASELRLARALSAYLEAEDARRFVFVRRVPGASWRGRLAPDGRDLVFPAGARLAIEPATGGDRRTLDVQASRVLGFLDPDRVALDGEEPMILRLSDGAHLAPLPAGASSFARAPGLFAVALESGEVVVYDDVTYEERARIETAMAAPQVSAAEGAWLIAGAGGVGRWPLAGGDSTARATLTSAVHAIEAGEAHRAILAMSDPSLLVLDADGLAVAPPIAADGPVSGAAWLGATLVVSAEGEGHLAVRNVVSRQRLDTLHVPPAALHRVESSGPRALIVALPDERAGGLPSASVFRFERHRLRRTRPMESSVRDVVVDAPRRRVVLATLRHVEALAITAQGLGETTTLAEVPAAMGIPERLAVAREGTIALTTDRGAVLVLAPGATETRTLEPPGALTPCPRPVVLSPDGEVVFSADARGQVRRYPRSGTGVMAPLEGGEGALCGLAISELGDAVAGASLRGELRIWDARDGGLERAVERPDLRFSDVRFTPDGERLLVADGAGGVHVVRRIDGAEDRLVRVHDGWIHRLAIARDGTHFATAGDDGTLRYLTMDGRIERVVRAKGTARSVDFSARDRFLYFGDTVHAVRLTVGSHVDATHPEALLQVAESRAGMRLEGLELVAAGP